MHTIILYWITKKGLFMGFREQTGVSACIGLPLLERFVGRMV
jgi:hypothetical protein